VTTNAARAVSPPATLILSSAGEYLFSPRNDTTCRPAFARQAKGVPPRV